MALTNFPPSKSQGIIVYESFVDDQNNIQRNWGVRDNDFSDMYFYFETDLSEYDSIYSFEIEECPSRLKVYKFPKVKPEIGFKKALWVSLSSEEIRQLIPSF